MVVVKEQATRDSMEKEELYRKAVEKWGRDNQMLIAIEEASELQKAVIKFMRYRTLIYLPDIAEEMADMEIMLEQLKLMLNNGDEVGAKKEEKLKRLEHLISGDVVKPSSDNTPSHYSQW